MQKIRNIFSKKRTKRNRDATNTQSNFDEKTEEIPSTSTADKSNVTVHVVCPSARIIHLSVEKTKTLEEMKQEVILKMSDDPVSMPLYATDMRQLSPRFRIYRAENQGDELDEDGTLEQLNIKDSETFFIALRRNTLQNLITEFNECESPTKLQIESATKDIPKGVTETPLTDLNEIFQQSNLQFEVRKVLISLAKSAADVLGTGPYARRLIEMFKQRLIDKQNLTNDNLTCLMDMGFKKESADYALKMLNNNYAAALEYLLQREEPDELPLEEAAMGVKTSDSVSSPSQIFANNIAMDNTKALLELVRIYGHREMPPSGEAIKSLIEMGFKEDEVIEALRKTCNNKAAAVEWLLGYRSDSLMELRDGISTDSEILKSILEMPLVQMNLSNPKVFIAFLSILENEQSLRLWGGDNDTTDIIANILQKYHEEKHMAGINQFYPNF